MNNILISIIVPAYNIETHLPVCLDSILAQTHRNIEVIVVNDGSIDNTGRIIDEYAKNDKRIVAIHKTNGGVSSARTAGINVAKGDYIGFVDGDDYIVPSMYEHLLYNAIMYNADISHCGYKMIFPNGRIELFYGTERIIEQTHEQGLLDLLRGDFIEPGLWNKLYKKDIVIYTASELWDETIRNNEDLLLNYILFSNCRFAIYEDKPLYHYLKRSGSASTTKEIPNTLLDPLKVFELILSDTSISDNVKKVAFTRYINILINISYQNKWIFEAKRAQEKLKREVSNSEFTNKCNSKKIRLMARIVNFSPALYRLIRCTYEKISGVSKKYEV